MSTRDKPVEKTWGYRVNRLRDWYPEGRYKPMLFLVAHKFYQKAISKAIEHDFGFTVNGYVSGSAWNDRGLRYSRSNRKGLKDWFIKQSKHRLGCVFIVCGARNHRPTIYIDKDKHLVLCAPPITDTRWPYQSLFKQAADYLNIDPDTFRPE